MKKAAEEQEVKVVQNLKGRKSILAEYNSIQSLIGTIQAKFTSPKNDSSDNSINSIKDESSAFKHKESHTDAAPISNFAEESPFKGKAEAKFFEAVRPKPFLNALNEFNHEPAGGVENTSVQPSLSINVSYSKR